MKEFGFVTAERGELKSTLSAGPFLDIWRSTFPLSSVMVVPHLLSCIGITFTSSASFCRVTPSVLDNVEIQRAIQMPVRYLKCMTTISRIQKTSDLWNLQLAAWKVESIFWAAKSPYLPEFFWYCTPPWHFDLDKFCQNDISHEGLEKMDAKDL